MAFEAGNVVVLKSGGQPMTVVSATEEGVECVWIGEEGEFFRHAIPAVALEVVDMNGEDEDEDEEEEGEGKGEEAGSEAAERSAA